MTQPTLTVIVGYIDLNRKSEGQTHMITLAGRRISVPDSSIISKHQIEPGVEGALRFFLSADAVITADMHVGDLLHDETHWSHDTALRPRQGMRAVAAPRDGETHFSHDTA